MVMTKVPILLRVMNITSWYHKHGNLPAGHFTIYSIYIGGSRTLQNFRAESFWALFSKLETLRSLALTLFLKAFRHRWRRSDSFSWVRTNDENKNSLKEVRSSNFQSYRFFLTSTGDHFQYPDMKFKKPSSPTFDPFFSWNYKGKLWFL